MHELIKQKYIYCIYFNSGSNHFFVDVLNPTSIWETYGAFQTDLTFYCDNAFIELMAFQKSIYEQNQDIISSDNNPFLNALEIASTFDDKIKRLTKTLLEEDFATLQISSESNLPAATSVTTPATATPANAESTLPAATSVTTPATTTPANAESNLPAATSVTTPATATPANAESNLPQQPDTKNQPKQKTKKQKETLQFRLDAKTICNIPLNKLRDLAQQYKQEVEDNAHVLEEGNEVIDLTEES